MEILSIISPTHRKKCTIKRTATHTHTTASKYINEKKSRGTNK